MYNIDTSSFVNLLFIDNDIQITKKKRLKKNNYEHTVDLKNCIIIYIFKSNWFRQLILSVYAYGFQPSHKATADRTEDKTTNSLRFFLTVKSCKELACQAFACGK